MTEANERRKSARQVLLTHEERSEQSRRAYVSRRQRIPMKAGTHEGTHAKVLS